jgi:hypothetical protein
MHRVGFEVVQDLAGAPASEVIRLWSGLGYNRRAVNLQRAAQAVVEQNGGEFPRDVDALETLPGIGPYTAGAIACFAFEQDVGFMDTNIRRLLHRLFKRNRLGIQFSRGVSPPREYLQCVSARILRIREDKDIGKGMISKGVAGTARWQHVLQGIGQACVTESFQETDDLAGGGLSGHQHRDSIDVGQRHGDTENDRGAFCLIARRCLWRFRDDPLAAFRVWERAAALSFHEREYERLRAELESAFKQSDLPELPSGAAALHDLLVRLRVGEVPR